MLACMAQHLRGGDEAMAANLHTWLEETPDDTSGIARARA